MPFVTAGLLVHLPSCAHHCDAVVPRTERGYHPLCAVSTRCAAEVARHLAEGRLAIIGLPESVRVHVVTGEELDGFGHHDRLLAKVNTPVEYEEIEALASHER
jgi:molybdopterin-guanine dinucleotide biosynthesis protein A